MTTPEGLRRRQLVEGALIILIGLLMIWQTWQFNSEDREQRSCLAKNFQELSVALDARSSLADRESEQNRKLWGIYAEAAGIIKASGEPAETALTKKQQAELNAELVDQLVEYQAEMKDIAAERKKNPLPPYPLGECRPD